MLTVDNIDVFLDLKELARRTCMSVRTLRADSADPVRPLPCYRKGGKVYVRWSEFCRWMDGFKHVAEPMDARVDERVRRLASRVS